MNETSQTAPVSSEALISKLCHVCQCAKPLLDYHRNCDAADGHCGICKDCARQRSRQWHAENREHVQARSKRYRARHREKMLAQKKEHYRENKPKFRNRGLQFKYGISVAAYDAILIKQNGVCAICGQPPLPHRCLCVDHVHGTTVVRGLLCDNCNPGIGFLKDDPTRCEAAAVYLRNGGITWNN